MSSFPGIIFYRITLTNIIFLNKHIVFLKLVNTVNFTCKWILLFLRFDVTGVPYKNKLLKISQYLYWTLFLIEFQALGPATLLETDTNTGIFPLIIQNFSEHLS